MNPAIIVTGASGFVGRHLLDDLKEQFRIFGLARRSQRDCGAPVHRNIAWMQVDIGNREALEQVFREIKTAGGARFLIHLAAYYDFTGEDCPEYQRTNVEGTRNVLELSADMHLQRFVFASSVAACPFPPSGESITEATPPLGEHKYAISKRAGEEMMREFGDLIPTCTVRFGAVYSDWCEYPPLYMFLNTWLGKSWRANLLAGAGESAIPYIHIRDIVRFLRNLVTQQQQFPPGEVLIASTSGSSSHRRLFELASRYWYGSTRKSVLLPRVLAAAGLYSMNWIGAITGHKPFERPWMRKYIDKKLNLNPMQTYRRLNWEPEANLHLERRMPFLVERLKSEPFEWHRRNLAIIRRTSDRPDLHLYNTLSDAEHEMVASLAAAVQSFKMRTLFPHFGVMPKDELSWHVRLLYHLLLTSIQSSNRLLLVSYAEISTSGRVRAGYSADELLSLFDSMHEFIIAKLQTSDEHQINHQIIYDRITLPILMAKDEITQQSEDYLRRKFSASEREFAVLPERAFSTREQLEQTIWNCLVQRK